MKFSFSVPIVSASGSIGGASVYGYKGKGIARCRSSRVRAQSPALQLSQSRLAAARQSWRALTENQRQGWRQAAAGSAVPGIKGVPAAALGYSAYVYQFIMARLCSQNAHTRPGLMVQVPRVTSCSLVASSAGPVLNLTVLPAFSGTYRLFVKGAAQSSPAANYRGNQYRLIRVQANNSGVALNIRADYQAVFPAAFRPGKRIQLHVYVVDTNSFQVSTSFYVSAIIT